jgi:hypothetical protein
LATTPATLGLILVLCATGTDENLSPRCKKGRVQFALIVAAILIIIPLKVYSVSARSETPISNPLSQQGPAQALAYPIPFYRSSQSLGTNNSVTQASSTSNAISYGGPVMHYTRTYAIFWLPSGYHFEGFFGSDSSYEYLISRFLSDVGGSNYYNIVTQYTDHTNGAPLDASSLSGYVIDTDPYPLVSNTLYDSSVRNEISNVINSQGWPAGLDSMFLVYTAGGISSCFSGTVCFLTTYCAYHDYYYLNNQPVIYGNMPDIDSVSGFLGCGGSWLGLLSPNGDHAADTEISITSHELFEAATDPLINAWLDTSGNEIGDKCLNQLGSINLLDGSNLILNGHKYIVQEEWSNWNAACVLSYGPSTTFAFHLSPSSTSQVGMFNVTYQANGYRTWTLSRNDGLPFQVYTDSYSQVIIGGYSPNPSSERWCFSSSCPGVAIGYGAGNFSTTIVYYDLLAQQPTLNAIYGGSPTTGFSYYTAPQNFGSVDAPYPQQASLSTAQQTYWILRGSQVSLPAVIPGGPGERWSAAGPTTWSISVPYSMNSVSYYHQYLVTFGYNIEDGGTGYSPPSVSYSLSGSPQMTPAGGQTWADATGYSFSSELPGSSSNERWEVSQQGSGLIASPGSVTTTYYHQFPILLSYEIVGGGGSSPPQITATYFGLTVSAVLTGLSPGQQVPGWLDAGSTYQMQGTLPGSTSSERWFGSGASGTIVGMTVIDATYYHQFFATFAYSIMGGGSPSPPPLQASSLGQQVSIELSTSGTANWLDAGTGWQVPSLLPPSTNTERWIAISQPSGTIESATTTGLTYKHQYYVQVTVASTGGGTAGPSTDWYDSGTTVHLVALAQQGWALGQWSGTGQSLYSGNSSAHNLQVNSPINEEATFYPGLTLKAGPDGSIAYSYGSTSATVEANTQSTIYVPPGEIVTVSGNPSSLVYSFTGWAGTRTGNNSPMDMTVIAPSALEASFSYNYLLFAILGGAGVAAVVGIFLYRRRV